MLDFDGPRVSPAQDKVRRSKIWLLHTHLFLKSHEPVFASNRLTKVAFTWSPSLIQGPGKLIVQYYWMVNSTVLHITPLQMTVRNERLFSIMK